MVCSWALADLRKLAVPVDQLGRHEEAANGMLAYFALIRRREFTLVLCSNNFGDLFKHTLGAHTVGIIDSAEKSLERSAARVGEQFEHFGQKTIGQICFGPTDQLRMFRDLRRVFRRQGDLHGFGVWRQGRTTGPSEQSFSANMFAFMQIKEKFRTRVSKTAIQRQYSQIVSFLKLCNYRGGYGRRYYHAGYYRWNGGYRWYGGGYNPWFLFLPPVIPVPVPYPAYGGYGYGQGYGPGYGY
jgi:hypothetical protein